jgi:hypothetical protein
MQIRYKNAAEAAKKLRRVGKGISLKPAEHWARKFKCSKHLVHAVRKDLGLPTYKAVIPRHKNYEALKADPELATASRSVLSKRHDCDPSYITRVRSEMGIKSMKQEPAWRPRPGTIYEKIEQQNVQRAELLRDSGWM